MLNSKNQTVTNDNKKKNFAQSEYRALANISRSHYVIISQGGGKFVGQLWFNGHFQHKYGYIRDECKVVSTVGVVLCCHSNATRASTANPPNSAQLGGIPYKSPSYIWVRATVWACGREQTDRHTDARDHNTFHVVHNSSEM